MSFRSKVWILFFASVILLSLSWPPFGFGFLLFFAFVPLLIGESLFRHRNRSFARFFLFVYGALLLWGALSSHWIFNASVYGFLFVLFLNPLIQFLPFLIYRLSAKKFSRFVADAVFAGSWLSIEFLHHKWALAFPVFTLGANLSPYPWIIQFYEYTGVQGGSLWILISNLSIYRLISIEQMPWSFSKPELGRLVQTIFVLTVPILLSTAIFFSYQEKGKAVNVIAVHPNVDVRNEKYSTSVLAQIDKHIEYSRSMLSDSTDYILWPETAITNGGFVESLAVNDDLDYIRMNLLRGRPRVKLITGCILFEQYRPVSANLGSQNIAFNSHEGINYATYNAAIQLRWSEGEVNLRTKARLVPVEETIPNFFGAASLRTIIGSLGGYLFSTRKENNDTFRSSQGVWATPLICYESLFSDLTASYVNQGASILFVLLNEGWYKSPSGAEIFMNHAIARAIENRRAVVRSSNDGISCFIDQRGLVSKLTRDFNGTAINGTVFSNREKTVYTILGNYIGSISIIITTVIVLVLLLKTISTAFTTR